MAVLANLQPHALWQHFESLNAVPRPSKKEEKVIAFMKSFGEELGLPTEVDGVGNVLIKKPASPGREGSPTIVLQSHLDMVHQKNEDTAFDFDLEGINMYVDGDWVKAQGTTLGADNGIGVATIMALLSSHDISHPALEALFTIDEETGLTGANALQPGWMSGSILLNLDTEDDRELTIGCAGGIDVTIKGDYDQVAVNAIDYAFYTIKLSGLTGGHSGMDIHLGRGNANKLMNRLLYNLSQSCQVAIGSIDGGGLRNAIPRESKATLGVAHADISKFTSYLEEYRFTITKEYKVTDPEMDLSWSHSSGIEQAMKPDFAAKLIAATYACPNGIYRMSPDVDDLVQSSNNLSRVSCSNGKFEVLCLTRSSVECEKYDLAHMIGNAFAITQGEVTTGGDYPGWTPAPHSELVKTMSKLYRQMFEEEPHVYACHAGLECGIIGKNYPNMEMISFGPNIRGAHSPDEMVQISSVQKYWRFLLATLENL